MCHPEEGFCLGAVGVSGVKSGEDAQIAKAGIAALSIWEAHGGAVVVVLRPLSQAPVTGFLFCEDEFAQPRLAGGTPCRCV